MKHALTYSHIFSVGTIDDPTQAFDEYLKQKDAVKLAQKAARAKQKSSRSSHSPDYYDRAEYGMERSGKRPRSPRRSSTSPPPPGARDRSSDSAGRRRSRSSDARYVLKWKIKGSILSDSSVSYL